MSSKRFGYFFVILLLTLGLAGCEQTKIGDITADPGSFQGKEISIAGEVTNAIGASIGSIGKGAYEVDDGTGKIWIYSEDRGVPSKGAHVGVKGRIAQSVTIMGRNYATIMRESNRRAEKAAR